MLKAGQTQQILVRGLREVITCIQEFFFFTLPSSKSPFVRQKDLVELLNKKAIRFLWLHQVHTAYKVGMVETDGQTHFWGLDFWDLVHLLDKWYCHISCIKMPFSSYFYKKA